MADNFDVKDAAGATVTIASSDTAGVQTTKHIVTSSALPTGAATAAKQPALGTAGTASSDVITIQGITSMTPLAITVATIPSHAVTNAGTFAVQVDGAGLTSLQLLDDTIFVDDAAFTPGTSKISMIGFQADEGSTDSVDEGDAGAARMTLDRKQIVNPQCHTAGGESSLSALSTAAVYTAEAKGAPGQVYSLEITNKGAAAVYARLYNQTGAPASTDGANIIRRFIVPGNATGAGIVRSYVSGMAFSTGIGIRVSGAIADNDTTSLAANEVMINVGFK